MQESVAVAHSLPEEARAYIADALIVLMFIALLGVLAIALFYRKTDKNGKDRRILVREALATLLGTFLGYVLSGIGEEGKGSG